MKAYIVKEKNEFCCNVVFAESASKAKALGKYMFLDCDYMDVEAKRLTEADYLYQGRNAMYWNNDEDRLFLVKECGWYCEEINKFECQKCVCKQYCPQCEREVENAKIFTKE